MAIINDHIVSMYLVGEHAQHCLLSYAIHIMLTSNYIPASAIFSYRKRQKAEQGLGSKAEVRSPSVSGDSCYTVETGVIEPLSLMSICTV